VTANPPRSLADRRRTPQGLDLPWVGLGVFQSPPGPTTTQAVRWALDAGYRLIDTAAMYGNEADVGEAVRASGIARDEIVVTSKVWHTEQGYERALEAVRRSHAKLHIGTIDLYLIHWPIAPSPADRLGSWRALERAKADGLVRAIGVANYTVRHLQELEEHAKVAPDVDQVEYHPFVYDPELERYLADRRVILEAYSPLTRGRRLHDPVVEEIAAAHARSPAQVLIRWGLEHGCVEIPKSVRRERIEENAQVFDFQLTREERAKLDGLANGVRISTTNPREIP
jgi:diketogulonate reductase-like aldo/keto reductase